MTTLPWILPSLLAALALLSTSSATTSTGRPLGHACLNLMVKSRGRITSRHVISCQYERYIISAMAESPTAPVLLAEYVHLKQQSPSRPWLSLIGLDFPKSGYVDCLKITAISASKHSTYMMGHGAVLLVHAGSLLSIGKGFLALPWPIVIQLPSLKMGCCIPGGQIIRDNWVMEHQIPLPMQLPVW